MLSQFLAREADVIRAQRENPDKATAWKGKGEGKRSLIQGGKTAKLSGWLHFSYSNRKDLRIARRAFHGPAPSFGSTGETQERTTG